MRIQTEMKGFKEFISEGKQDYQIYHKSYTEAIQEMEAFAKKNGYELDDDEMFDKIGNGPRKPGEGKTNSFNIDLYKGGKKVNNRRLHAQVYGMGSRYELNMYIQ